MTIKPLLLAVALIAAFTAGCDKKPTTAQQIETLQAETKAAAQDMKDYTFAQKDEFTENMKRQLAAINQDLDALEAKLKNSSDAAKAEAEPKLQALREKAAQLGRQIDGAKDATESTWDTVKATSKKGYDELKDGFMQAHQWASEKIAP
jgi:hypothetical protein